MSPSGGCSPTAYEFDTSTVMQSRNHQTSSLYTFNIISVSYVFRVFRVLICFAIFIHIPKRRCNDQQWLSCNCALNQHYNFQRPPTNKRQSYKNSSSSPALRFLSFKRTSMPLSLTLLTIIPCIYNHLPYIHSHFYYHVYSITLKTS